MATLSLQTVELTTSESTAPLNGPPSSADYNEYQRSVLVDLSAISDMINDIVLPLIQVLDSSALGTVNIGIQGSTVYSDTSDQTDTFFDQISEQPLVVADSLRLLRALITQLQNKINNIAIQIASLESKTTSINQNDIASSLASLVSQINNLTLAVSSNATEINDLGSQISSVNGSQELTGSIPAKATITVPVTLTSPYSDNNYTVSLAVQDPTGMLEILSFTYQTGGTGVNVLVRNNSSTTALTGTVNAITKHF